MGGDERHGQLIVCTSATRRPMLEVRSRSGSVPEVLITPVDVQVIRQRVVADTW
jgi:hypothetical protein